ncbi:hypothetical protein [Hyphomicrobium sp.]|uniref:hypothetical protein n=1 Tax=Hyphomicrobium sp. TaxID=82 RepID=UPI002E37A5D9|nr:hypothetical protein [Hyphomicrobium sp.]HEX2841518.1 hypothetical protein [Hyphomicrobium sp.]
MKVEVVRDRNGFEVRYGADPVSFEVSGIEVASAIPADFSLWLMLPLAMRQGANLEIDAPVDPIALENARGLARVWAMWVPELYRPIEIHAPVAKVSNSSDQRGSVLLFSGGVDSTYALISEKERANLTHGLTVQGLDYKSDDSRQFQDLLHKTRALLDENGIHHISVKTNAGRHVRQLGMTHAFVLASCLFLCSGRFSRGVLAADLTLAQDMMVFPWGTNHVTNAYFAGSEFRMDTVSQGVSRIRKLECILGDKTALHAISFCGIKRFRPHNCGICPKCLRTKIMLLALTGECPDIFSDRTISASQVRKLDVASRAAYKHYAEIISVARERGFLDRIPGLEQHVAASLDVKRRKAVLRQFFQKILQIPSFG